MKRNRGMIILFLTPAVLMFSIIFLYPIIRTIIMSFFKIDGITDPVANWQFTGLPIPACSAFPCGTFFESGL